MPAKGQELAPRASLPGRPATYGSMPMNKPISAKDVAAPKVTTGALPGSRKVYSAPKGHADLAVSLRETWIKACGGVQAYYGRAVKAEDNGNVAQSHLAREFAAARHPLRGLAG